LFFRVSVTIEPSHSLLTDLYHELFETVKRISYKLQITGTTTTFKSGNGTILTSQKLTSTENSNQDKRDENFPAE